MTKKDKKKPTYNDIEFDSNEEIRVYQWLEEAIEERLVEHFVYQPRTFTLCEAIPTVRRRYKLLKRLPFIKWEEREVNKVGKFVYTPDFEITFTDNMFRYYPDAFLADDSNRSLIDVKGDFSRGKNNTSGITFGIKAAWVFHKHGEFVQKITPRTLFKKTWVPEKARYSPVQKKLVKEWTQNGYKTREEAQDYRDLLDDLISKSGDSLMLNTNTKEGKNG